MKTRMLSALGLGLIFLGSMNGAGARQWKDIEGRIIEADFVSSTGDKVTIRKGGKEFTLPLDRLSATDRDWIADQGTSKPDTDKSDSGGAAVTGLIKDHPVTVLYRQTPKEWADGRVARKCSEADMHVTPHKKECPTGFEDCVTREDQSCLVYVPDSYRCDEIAGMGHSTAAAKDFAVGLDWLESNPENAKSPKSKD